MNYVKAIDKYLIVCFLFVFCSLLEYAIVLLLDRGKRKFEKEKNEVRDLVTYFKWSSFDLLHFFPRKDWGRIRDFFDTISTDGTIRLGTFGKGFTRNNTLKSKRVCQRKIYF